MLSARNIWRLALTLIFIAVLAAAYQLWVGDREDQPGGRVEAYRGSLDVYNWPYYMVDSLLVEFERECSCKVNYREFPSNEVLLTAVENKSGGWDVAFPSDYMVSMMARKGLLVPIQKDLLANTGNLSSSFLDREFDPGNRYSLPYIWGATGIGYRKSRVESVPEDYDVLWDPRYEGKIGMLDDMRFTMAGVLAWKGLSVNTSDVDDLAAVEVLLKQQKPLVKAYNSENYVDLLANEEVWLFYGYSGDIIQAIPDNPDIGFVIPESGGVVYIDNMVIPNTADELALAHEFMDFLMREDVAATIINERRFAMPNVAAEALVRAEIRNNPGVYPPADIMERCQSVQDIGESVTLYEQVWQRVKAD